MASIRANPFFNDPAFAQAAANLSSLFDPPSGADAAGWAAARAHDAEAMERNANARAKIEAARRLADNYGFATAPNFDRAQFDRRNIAAGSYAPTQSYYAVDTGDATARRGQDIDARTSITNNENTTRGSTIASLYGPLDPGQLRPSVPADIASTIGLPSIDRAAGASKPLSQDEFAAQRQADAYGKGMLSDQDFVDILLGKDAPVQAIGPDGRTPVFMAPGAAVRTSAQPARPPVAPSDLATLQNERAAIAAANPSDPRLREYDQRIGALGRGAAQDAYSIESDKGFAKRNEAIQAAATAAQSKLSTLDYMRQILATPNLDTGAGADARLQLRKAAQAIGIDVGNVSSAEALAAVSNQFALELRNPEGGAGMPGALSDSDRRFLQSMVPGLQNTPAGNQRILDYAARVAERNVEIERLRQRYVRQHGRIDEGFAAAVSDYAGANPLFPEAARTAPAGSPSAAPAAGGFRILKVE